MEINNIGKIAIRKLYRALDRLFGFFDYRSVEVIAEEEIEKRILPGRKIIFYVGKKYDYGKRDWGLSYDHIIFYCTLARMDYSLVYFDYDRFKQRYGAKKMSRILREAVYLFQPEILFYSHSEDWVDHKLWQEISEELPTRSIIFLPDDHMQYDSTKPVWKLFNLVVTTDKNGLERRKREGFGNVFLGQYACNHFIYKNLGLEKIYDVAFVGRCYGERKEFVDGLRKKGINVKTFGQGWEKGERINRGDLVKVYNMSKISLNMSLSYAYVYTIKGRDFEPQCCGSMLFTRDSKDIAEYFAVGREIVTYKDAKDAAEKIKYYLEHGKEREIIAENGRRKTLESHTYEKRLRDIFDHADGLKKNKIISI